MASTGGGDGRKDLFISYAGPDRPWAEWVAWHLRDAGYTVELDIWDWAPGENAVLAMSNALSRCDRVIALYSHAYFERPRFTTDEWTSILGQRPDSRGRRRLLPLRIEDVDIPEPILSPIVYCDLFGLPADQAREALLTSVAGPPQFSGQPSFPGTGPGSAFESRPPGALPSVWNVGTRNPAFAGRSAELADLRAKLVSGERAVVQALHGMGGVGKTQLAIEYAHLFSGQYRLVWWIDAEEPELIGDQLAALGTAAGWVQEDTPITGAMQRVRRHLGMEAGWLIIFDNATSATAIQPWIPQGPGHVIITSRRGDFGGVAATVEVEVFTREESLTFLNNSLTLAKDQADQLASSVGDLPLALAQAAGLMSSTRMTASEYLLELDTHAAELLSDPAPPGYPSSLAIVVAVAMDRISRVDLAAAQLLRICAHLAPEPIPLRWLTSAPAEAMPSPLARAAGARLPFRRTLGRISEFALARIDTDHIQIHRLTQMILRDQRGFLESVQDRMHAENLIAQNAPQQEIRDPASWSKWADLLPHLLALRPAVASATLRPTALKALFYLFVRGDYTTARTHAQEWHAHWLPELGPDHMDVLAVEDHLATTLERLGEFAQARQLHEGTLSRRRKLLGDDHPDTLSSANSLANDFYRLGEYALARELRQDTLTRRQRVLGSNHPDTLRSADNLANDLHGLREFELARQLREDTLARRRHLLGEDHPDTLNSANNLANDLHELGEHERAREIDEEVWARRRITMGEDHPDTLSSADSLANDLRKLGDFVRAQQIDEEVLIRRRRVLGDDHPATQRSAANLELDLHYLKSGERSDSSDAA